ncbi:MAG: iron ABC transporter permease [Bacteroidetes bacterium]|nr:iron ABC transporter permease [Bacteroidota bacterium]MBU1719060.1 iron ABC transporter permease [Bacteroidota bacterium]
MNLLSIKKAILLFSVLLLFCVLLFFLDLLVGSANIPAKEVWRAVFSGETSKSGWDFILFDSRIPRAFTAVLAGASLAVSGLLMQTLFRNPLAGPYVLGVSSGATFGAAILILATGSAGLAGVLGSSWPLAVAAWLGAALVMVLIFAVSLFIKNFSTLLILGIMFGSALGAVVGILQYFGGAEEIRIFVLWTMGSLTAVAGTKLWLLAIAFIVSIFLALIKVKPLNALLLGEEYSHSLGYPVKRTAISIVIVTSLLAGTVTAFCGPIAFVGIAVPHICRFLFKTADHRILIPAVVLSGMAFMLIADMISQLPDTTSRLPINTVTALFGAPVVIAVIIRGRNSGGFFRS